MINEIFIGIIVTIIGTIIIYFYKKRQLYAVIPKMYEFSYFSDNGTVYEVKILNKGLNIEEDILLDINSDKNIELLSASTSSIELNDNQIKIPRLFPDTEASMILSIDNGRLSSKDLISITSKSAKGFIFNDILEVPPRIRSFIHGALAFALVGFIFYFNLPEKAINLFNGFRIENAKLKSEGWSSLNGYYESDLSDSYSDEEFPIRLVNMKENGRLVAVTYEIINKSSLPIKVTVWDNVIYNMFTIKNATKNELWHNYDSTKTVEPLSKANISIESLKDDSENIIFRFDIQFGTDNIYNLLHSIFVKPYGKLTDNYTKSTLVGKWKSKISDSFFINENYEENGNYEIYIWGDELKNKLYQHTTGVWDVRNGLVYISNISNGRKILKFKFPSRIYNITDKEIIEYISDYKIKVIKTKLPDDSNFLPKLTDRKIREKIIGKWVSAPNERFYKIYDYKKDETVTMDAYLNKAKTVKLLSSKAKWKIKNRLLTYEIVDSHSEHNISIGSGLVTSVRIIDITDNNISYYNHKGMKSYKFKLTKKRQ